MKMTMFFNVSATVTTNGTKKEESAAKKAIKTALKALVVDGVKFKVS